MNRGLAPGEAHVGGELSQRAHERALECVVVQSSRYVALPLFVSVFGVNACLRSEGDAGDLSGAQAGGRNGTGGSLQSSSSNSGFGGESATGGRSGTGGRLSFGGSANGGSANGGGLGASGSSAGQSSSSAADGLPCDVRAILRTHCSTCHGASPQFGAPYALATAADLRAHGAAILRRIADDTRPMPPEPNARLSAEERATLDQYIQAGAPESTCAASDPVTTDPDPTAPTTPNDPSVTCYKVTARASSAGAKYSVPMQPDLYQCFNWALPWGVKPAQIVSARPIIDNSKVLHHWILYNTDSAVQDGTNSGCVGAHPNAAMVTGWAPGGEPLETPADVGIGVAPGGFVLELHYNNSVGGDQTDASGVELCVTDKLRPNEAAVHWLGTQSLNKINASGTCRPANSGDVTILSSTPHMHLQGRHLKTVINRAGGSSEVLIDKAFDFNTQVSYPTRTVIKKGDTLTTTCTFATPTPFGEGTNQEMCYNFVLAYPAGGLAQAFQLLRKNDCTGAF